MIRICVTVKAAAARIPFLAASGIAALVIPPAQVAIAADYQSVEAAQRGLFAQAERFDEVVLALNLGRWVAGVAGHVGRRSTAHVTGPPVQ